MADNEVHRLQEIHKQAAAAARAAEARQKYAHTSYIQRQAEREAADKQEDYCRGQIRQFGHRPHLEAGLRTTIHDAKFASRTASDRVKAAEAVATQADNDHTETSRAASVAKANMGLKRSASEPQLRDHLKPAPDATNGSPLPDSVWDEGAGKEYRQSEQYSRRGEQTQDQRKEDERKKQEARQEHESVRKDAFRAVGERLGRRFSGMAVGPSIIHRVWKKEVECALEDVSVVKIFPELPQGKCAKPACLAGQSQRALKACPCDVEAAFTLLGMPLKEARNAFHPDRWAKCPEEHRDSFQVCIACTAYLPFEHS